MITSISGKIESGKDTIAKIIQHLVYSKYIGEDLIYEDRFPLPYIPNQWQVKKFAGKLKIIVSLLTGIPVEDLEKQEIKDSYLGEEWNYWEDKSEYGQRWIYEGDRTDFKESKNITFHRMKVRDMLQLLGTEALRNVIHPNVHVNALFADYPFSSKNKELFFKERSNYSIQQLKESYRGTYEEIKQKYINSLPKWIISDLRFPNEAQAVKDRGGITVRVNRKTLTRPYDSNSSVVHPSETALDDYKFDYIINNDGTIEELVEKVKVMLQYYNII